MKIVSKRKYSENDVREINKRTVEGLQRLYAIVVALALTTGIRVLLESTGIIKDVNQDINQSESIFLFIAFLITLIVFYHGMNRHLEDTFLINNKYERRREGLPIDILVFIIEGGLFVTMAFAITDPKLFFYSWSLLLAIDIVWSILVYLIQNSERPLWALNNFIFLIAAWISWFYIRQGDVIAIAVIQILRNITDYSMYWWFYFPETEKDNN